MGLLIFIIIVILVYVLLGILLYTAQELMIFKGAALPDNYVFKTNSPFKEINLTTSDGGSLHCLHFHENGSIADDRRLVLYFHGNEGNLSDWANTADLFINLGFDVLIPDYRGYGKSRGLRNESLLLADAQLWYNESRKNYKQENIFIYGRSLGSGFAVWLASNNDPAALILETPYHRLVHAAPGLVRLYPFNFLEKFPLRSDKYIKNVTCPLTVFHGTKDKTIPYRSAKDLFKAAKMPQKEMLTFEGGGHGDLPSFPGFMPALTLALNNQPRSFS